VRERKGKGEVGSEEDRGLGNGRITTELGFI
jgi:hypothetical protein